VNAHSSCILIFGVSSHTRSAPAFTAKLAAMFYCALLAPLLTGASSLRQTLTNLAREVAIINHGCIVPKEKTKDSLFVEKT
jgi:hypothetical protein